MQSRSFLRAAELDDACARHLQSWSRSTRIDLHGGVV
jgi:hypothetical protein